MYLDPSGGMYTTPTNKSFGIFKIPLLILYHPTNSLSVVICAINVSRLSLYIIPIPIYFRAIISAFIFSVVALRQIQIINIQIIDLSFYKTVNNKGLNKFTEIRHVQF